MIYYQDEKIIIREICSEDVVDLFSCWIDKEINAYDPRPLPKNSRDLASECTSFCMRFDAEVMNENVEDRKYRYFIITNIEDNFIGFINFFNIDKGRKQGELGVVIADKEYRHKGIAYTAIRFIMNYIFENMDIDRICIETGENNKQTLWLFKKLGFEKYGEYIEEDDFKFIVMEKKKE